MGDSFTHFVSLELEPGTGTLRKYQDFLSQLEQINGIGKKMKMESLHVTIGILSLKVEEIPEMRRKMKRVAERFQDLLMYSHGFMLTTPILEDEAIEYIADLRFSPHLTIFQKSSLGTEERAQLQESSNFAKLGAIVATGMTLREKK